MITTSARVTRRIRTLRENKFFRNLVTSHVAASTVDHGIFFRDLVTNAKLRPLFPVRTNNSNSLVIACFTLISGVIGGFVSLNCLFKSDAKSTFCTGQFNTLQHLHCSIVTFTFRRIAEFFNDRFNLFFCKYFPKFRELPLNKWHTWNKLKKYQIQICPDLNLKNLFHMCDGVWRDKVIWVVSKRQAAKLAPRLAQEISASAPDLRLSRPNFSYKSFSASYNTWNSVLA